MRPIVGYPAAQIINSAGSAQLSTSSSIAVAIPLTQAGFRPAFVRVAVSSGAAYINPQSGTSTTAVTGDSIVTSSEALWLNTTGLNAIAFLQVPPGGVAFGNVSACEEGAVRPPSTTGSNTAGLG